MLGEGAAREGRKPVVTHVCVASAGHERGWPCRPGSHRTLTMSLASCEQQSQSRPPFSMSLLRSRCARSYVLVDKDVDCVRHTRPPVLPSTELLFCYIVAHKRHTSANVPLTSHPQRRGWLACPAIRTPAGRRTPPQTQSPSAQPGRHIDVSGCEQKEQNISN